MKIPRIIFNFNDRCLNGCPFCFIPFDRAGTGTPDLWKRILKRIQDFSPDLISFSGCDPLYYDDFYDVLAESEKNCSWGMDTSLIFLNREKFLKIHKKIDLISTSLDDDTSMPIPQRYSSDKLELFYDNLAYVHSLIPHLVVHTLYTQRNRDYLFKIADTLIEKGISIWSLYQFWPFAFISNSEQFESLNEEFAAAGKRLAEYCKDKIDFDYVHYEGRVNGYFFVSSIGNVYTTVDTQPAKYVQLGSIFDENIYEKWRLNSSPDRAQEILSMKLKREKG